MSEEEVPYESVFTPAHEDAVRRIQEIAEKYFESATFFCEVRNDAHSGAGARNVYRGFYLGGHATCIGLCEIHKHMIKGSATDHLTTE